MPATSFFVRDPQHTQRSCCTLAQAGATGTGDDSLFLSRCRGRGSQNRAVATATSPDNNPCRSRKYCARKRITLLLFFWLLCCRRLGAGSKNPQRCASRLRDETTAAACQGDAPHPNSASPDWTKQLLQRLRRSDAKSISSPSGRGDSYLWECSLEAAQNTH